MPLIVLVPYRKPHLKDILFSVGYFHPFIAKPIDSAFFSIDKMEIVSYDYHIESHLFSIEPLGNINVSEPVTV